MGDCTSPKSDWLKYGSSPIPPANPNGLPRHSGFLVSGLPAFHSTRSMSTSSTEEPAAMSSSSSLAAITVSAPAAVGSCAAMAFFYVALLYSPTVILRLPPPSSLESFLIRRFACAAVSSAVSLVTCALLLGIKDFPIFLLALGIRKDHMGQAVAIPLFLTSLLYAGTIVSNSWGLVCRQKDREDDYCCGVSAYERVGIYTRRCLYWMESGVRNILVWRNYVVAPFTEELVFRACMIPLLLCGGFKTYSIIFFCPIFFSLAHLNHFLELYYQQRYSAWKAFMTVGLQLGYTVIFGWYAAFLFIRTGNLLPPIVAHIFCNMMGLPVLSSSRTKERKRSQRQGRKIKESILEWDCCDARWGYIPSPRKSCMRLTKKDKRRCDDCC